MNGNLFGCIEIQQKHAIMAHKHCGSKICNFSLRRCICFLLGCRTSPLSLRQTNIHNGSENIVIVKTGCFKMSPLMPPFKHTTKRDANVNAKFWGFLRDAQKTCKNQKSWRKTKISPLFSMCEWPAKA